MAKIKKIQDDETGRRGYQKHGATRTLVSPDMETVEETLETHSVRLPKKWVDIMEELATSLSLLREKKIRSSDIIREAVFQYCVKKALKDERETILRSSKSFQEREVVNG